ncbi:hypothetical protein D0864_06671, partial [Hortaea werneckii]
LFASLLWHSQERPSKPVIASQAAPWTDLADSKYTNLPNATLHARDEYQCDANKPCGNGACCGGSGYCGYGPTYCGTDCVSDCDAVAECGKYAKVPGTTCPLNTCCSEFGFCGTTSDFCKAGCQSNCILEPKPPGSKTSGSMLESRVIGYYEAWSARKSCHKVKPTDLPLDALTQVNFAFAYIDPKTYRIVTMDAQTPSSLFKDTANLKSIKPSLEVFVSVGGWTFSDDGTPTQPVFSDIASDPSKRQTFADNVVDFMKLYESDLWEGTDFKTAGMKLNFGFDGIDLDWEYPGAPDRGGKPEDTKNYVALMKTLRETFDASGNTFGLTFTAPSSYWYLRWFDLPGLIRHVDYINLMSYDLHGVWDRDNPIGSIVQSHTNLTEIKLAAELFWRVKIPASKIVMGFGFYGRSFTLSDPSCDKPGCQFSGASTPGPCSDAGGILAYYEIMDALEADKSIKPTHDSKAAINYFKFDKDQWISYDDEKTFRQKIDWANSMGFGGALIWASDLDDDQYSAHAALIGREVRSSAQLQLVDKALSAPQSVIQNLAGSNGQDCFKHTGKCVDLDDDDAMAAACGSGYTVVGWDDAGCGTKKCHCGKPICCPVDRAPKDCRWRGDNNGKGASSDCSAQCFPGEVNVAGIMSSWGGGFINDGNTNKCGRGKKSFCCPNPDAVQVTSACSYAPCRESCPSGTKSVFSKTDECIFGSQQYCCPEPVELKDCHWTGGSGGEECSNAVCDSTELELARAQFGGSAIGGCSWGRKKAACCTIEKATPKPASCSADLCEEIPGYCSSMTGTAENLKRDVQIHDSGLSLDLYSLEKRETTTYKAILYTGSVVVVTAANYPRIGRLFKIANRNQVLKQAFRLIPGYCLGPSVQELAINVGTTGVLRGLQAEHPIDVSLRTQKYICFQAHSITQRQIMAAFIESAAAGTLRGKAQNIVPAIGAQFFEIYWNYNNPLLSTLPRIGGPDGISPSTINDRIMECFGSNFWPEPLLPTEASINAAKGRLMNFQAATGIDTIMELAKAAVLADTPAAADKLLQAVRVGIAVFDYINTPDATSKWNLVRQQIFHQFGLIENVYGVANLQRWWLLFSSDYFVGVQEHAQRWADEAISAAAAEYLAARAAGHTLATDAPVMNTLKHWLNNYVPSLNLPDSSSTFGAIPLPQSP